MSKGLNLVVSGINRNNSCSNGGGVASADGDDQDFDGGFAGCGC